MKEIIFADWYKTTWRVFIISDGKRKSFFHFHSPIKAMRYAYMLKKKSGLEISRKALSFLSGEIKSFKAIEERIASAEKSVDAAENNNTEIVAA